MDEIKIPIDSPNKHDPFVVYIKSINPEATDEEVEKAWENFSGMTLTDKIVKMMNEYGEELAQNMQEKFRETVQLKAKEQEDALIKGISKGLGLEQDPMVRVSDVESIVRKAILDLQGSQGGRQSNPPGNTQPNKEEPDEEPKFDFAKRIKEDPRSGLGVA